MNENEILLGFKEAKYTSEEVFAFYQKLKGNSVRYPLSEGQKGLWMLHKLDPASNVYNVPICFHVRTALNVSLFREAFEFVIRRHPLLRNVIIEEEGVPYFSPKPFDPINFQQNNISDLSDETLSSLLRQQAKMPFDLSADSLVRAFIYCIAPDNYIVLIVVHHIVFDGASSPIFLHDLLSIYDSLLQGSTPNDLAISANYNDFTRWEQEFLASQIGQKHRDFWLTTLSGPLPILELNIERKRPSIETIKGETYTTTLSSSVSSKVNDFCLKQKIKPAVFFLAVYQLLLHRYTGERDLIIGMPTIGRPKLEFYNLVGYFVNMMPLRTHIDDNKIFIEYLKELNFILADGIDHSVYPFPRIVRDLNVTSNTGVHPVFQVSYTFQNKNMLQMTSNEKQSPLLQSIEFIEEICQEGEFKLLLEVFEGSEKFVLFLKYDANRFERKEIQTLMTHYHLLMDALMNEPELPLGRYSFLSKQERHQLLNEWNDTIKPYAKNKCLHELFEAQVVRTPNNVALVFDDQQLTYAELNAKANQVARCLRQKGVVPDTVVGICIERSLEMVIGLLGIMKAGGLYMPIEPTYPAERIKYMIENSGVSLLLSQSYLPAAAYIRDQQVIYLDTGSDAKGNTALFSQHSIENISTKEISLSSNHLAYVIYTSGSTGHPKGVMMEHRAVVNRIEWMQNEYCLNESDVVLQKTPLSFDVSVWEFAWPILTGARLVLAKPGGHTDAHYLMSLIQQTGVTTLHFVPSMLRLIVDQDGWHDCTSIRHIFCSGETLASDLPGKHYARNRAKLHNLYGPTEAAIDVSAWTCPDDLILNTVPIGKPIQNIQLYVLNDYYQPQAIGCVGELYIAGDGLARGYLNKIELTQEKFVQNIFSKNPEDRMYKTGDLVRWLPDGNLEFVERLDDQVKIRGFRIELGEIETQLSRHTLIYSCVVMAREDNPGNKQLVAYVVLNNDSADINYHHVLSKHLQNILPDYMIPSAFVVLDHLPVTINGKMDRKAFPAPNMEAYARQQYLAPQTETEKILVKIWAELLGLEEEKISINDNFFALGGHSLLITRLLSRLQNKELNIDIHSVFNSSSLTDLAAIIDKAPVIETYIVPSNSIPDNCDRITSKMLPLVKLNIKDIEKVVATVPGGASNIQDIYPLAPLQEGILFHHLMEPQNDPYILSGLFSVQSRLQLDDFLDALQAVINRHDVLRTAIVTTGLAEPVQVVYRSADLVVEKLNFDSDADIEKQMRALLQKQRTMNIGQAPLLRLKIAEDLISKQWFILFDMHHIIDDATSLGFLFNEVILHLKKQEYNLSKPVPYRNFVAHTLHQIQSTDAEAFFRKTLGDLTESTLPFNLRNVHGDGRGIKDLRHSLSPELARAIRVRAKELHLSPASLFHAAWALVVAICSSRKDVVFGTVLSGRLQGTQGVERMLGNFINTLPLRVKLQDKSVKQLVLDTDIALRELIRYEQASLSLAQNCSALPNDIPLFSAMLNFRHMESNERINESELENFGIKSLVGVLERTNYPIVVSVDDLGEEFSIDAQVDQSQSAASVISYLETAIAGIVDALATKTSAQTPALNITILPASERQKLLSEGSNAANFYSNDSYCLHELFEAQAEQNPNNIALIFGNERLTYTELNTKANQVAHYLHQEGVKPDMLVGLCVERSLEMVIGILGILKAGGAYVPIDPTYPTERIRYILEDSGVTLLLTQSHLLEQLPITKQQVIYLDTNTDAQGNPGIISKQPTTNIDKGTIGLNLNHLAYVIYTSGSTGKPKGVLVQHSNVTRLFYSTEEKFHFAQNDVWTLFHSFSFDFSVWELWGALIYGGRVVIVPKHIAQSSLDFYQLLIRERVTILNQTPTVFEQLIGIDLQEKSPLYLRTIIFGGEALNPAILKPWFARHSDTEIQLVNMYGITETTVHVTYQRLYEKGENQKSIIGKKLPDLKLYVLNDQLSLVPIGVTGEIYVGGAGVTRGYLNRPELTQERFIQNPFNNDINDRLYKTGDLARWLSDGNLEFVSRADDQVKIRGFRIELGEIQNVVAQSTAIREAVVLQHELVKGENSLIVYCTVDKKIVPAAYNILTMLNNRAIQFNELYRVSNGMEICGLNQSETVFVYDEIFTHRSYDQHGIFVKEGDCIFDVGANIGMFGIYLTAKIPNLRIFSFEPLPPIYDVLDKNGKIYGDGSIIPVCLGLSDSDKEVEFNFYLNNSLVSGIGGEEEDVVATVRNYLLSEADKQQTNLSPEQLETLLQERLEKKKLKVSLSTISKQIRVHHIESIALLKIDVERSELDVLNGIELDDWKKIDQIVIEVHDIDNALVKVQNILISQGYIIHTEQEGNLRNTNLYNIFARRSEIVQVAQEYKYPSQKYSGPSKLREQIETLLKEQLPSYMLPSRIMLLDNLPLTYNGKVDYKALPAPNSDPYSHERYIGPQTDIEKILVDIWVELLQIDPRKISTTDNFFSLGGNSLLVTRLVNLIKQHMSIELPIQIIFDEPSIVQLANKIEQRTPIISDSVKQNVDAILESIDLIEDMTEEELNSLTS